MYVRLLVVYHCLLFFLSVCGGGGAGLQARIYHANKGRPTYIGQKGGAADRWALPSVLHFSYCDLRAAHRGVFCILFIRDCERLTAALGSFVARRVGEKPIPSP